MQRGSDGSCIGWGVVMRKITLTLAFAVSVWTGAWAGEVVRLDGPKALEQLRATNPSHYAKALKILAEANHLCRPTQAQIQHARPEAKDESCESMLLRTSNPPKREVRFSLDHTTYVALVALTDDPARLIAANGLR